MEVWTFVKSTRRLLVWQTFFVFVCFHNMVVQPMSTSTQTANADATHTEQTATKLSGRFPHRRLFPGRRFQRSSVLNDGDDDIFQHLTFVQDELSEKADPTILTNSNGQSKPVFEDDRNSVARVVDTQVKCTENSMNVALLFDRPFNGAIYARDKYEAAACRFWNARSLNDSEGAHSQAFTARLRIPIVGCGTTARRVSAFETHITYESILIIQQRKLGLNC